MEKISLQNVRELLHRVEEVVGLWCVLLNHQFHIITSALPLDMQSVLCSLTFKTLIITGKEVIGSVLGGSIVHLFCFILCVLPFFCCVAFPCVRCLQAIKPVGFREIWPGFVFLPCTLCQQTGEHALDFIF